jgi:hypothetical protein
MDAKLWTEFGNSIAVNQILSQAVANGREFVAMWDTDSSDGPLRVAESKTLATMDK